MPRQCRNKSCKLGDSNDNPLYKCRQCKHRWHSACHIPHPVPRELKNWTCVACTRKGGPVNKPYNEKESVTSSGHSHTSSLSSFTSSVPQPAPPAQSAVASSSMARPASSIASTTYSAPRPSEDEPPSKASAIIKCRCGKEVLIQSVGSKQEPQPFCGKAECRPPIKTKPAVSVSPAISEERRFPSPAEKRKLLSDKATARKGGLASRQTVPPQGGEWKATSAPPKTAGQPQQEDGEPARKRARVSPSQSAAAENRPNGYETGRPGWVATSASSKPFKPSSPLGSRTASGCPHEKPGKLKMTAKVSRAPGPIRKMAPPVFMGLDQGRPFGTGGWPEPQQNGFTHGVERANVHQQPALNGLNGINGINGGSGFSSQHIQKLPNKINLTNGDEPHGLPTQMNGVPPLEPERAAPSDQCSLGFFDEEEGPSRRDQVPPREGLFSKFPGISKSTSSSMQKMFQPQPVRKQRDLAALDTLLYSQDGASTPPPEIQLPQREPALSVEQDKESQPLPPDEPYYADTNPHLLYPQPHSEAWHATKQEEIKARGTRKQNFGKAAESLRKQRLARKAAGEDSEDEVPESLARDPTMRKIYLQVKALKNEEPVQVKGKKPAGGPSNNRGGKRPGSGRRKNSANKDKAEPADVEMNGVDTSR